MTSSVMNDPAPEIASTSYAPSSGIPSRRRNGNVTLTPDGSQSASTVNNPPTRKTKTTAKPSAGKFNGTGPKPNRATYLRERMVKMNYNIGSSEANMNT